MGPPAVQASGLCKRYRIGALSTAPPYRTFREAIVSLARFPSRRSRGPDLVRHHAEHIWALKDVSFQVPAGQAVGIIGRNGAGKSTLLKILSRVTEPTAGEAVIRGRVASLLEVGTGFHPELTGRENVFLNGSILGMSHREMRRKLDEIVSFAEVERFVDTPVKHYSSGMTMRLAFAVAAHLDPEILVIDEVLAVGDAAFQKKCLGRMETVASQGRTVLFVSHNLPAVRRLCSRAILLRGGRLAEMGEVDSVVNRYLADIQVEDEVRFPDAEAKTAYFTRLCVRNVQGDKTVRIPQSEPFSTELEYVVRRSVRGDHLSWQLATADGIEVLGSVDVDSPEPLPLEREAGRYVAQVVFPGGILNDGLYQFRVAISSAGGEFRDYRYGNYFEIQDDTDWVTGATGGRRNGVILQRLLWREHRVE
jgi:lipopolysaccharide transport system ATP-binding protein